MRQSSKEVPRILFSLVVLTAAAACRAAPSQSGEGPGIYLAATPEPPVWNTYADVERGFTFEYLAQYDQDPMKGWGCGITLRELEVGSPLITFGTNNHLELAPAYGLSLDEYASQFVAQFSAVQYPNRDDDRLSQHDPPGIVVEAVIAHHGAVFALFQRGDTVFKFISRLSLACSAPDQGIINPDPFWRAVESFRFTR